VYVAPDEPVQLRCTAGLFELQNVEAESVGAGGGVTHELTCTVTVGALVLPPELKAMIV